MATFWIPEPDGRCAQRHARLRWRPAAARKRGCFPLLRYCTVRGHTSSWRSRAFDTGSCNDRPTCVFGRAMLLPSNRQLRRYLNSYHVEGTQVPADNGTDFLIVGTWVPVGSVATEFNIYAVEEALIGRIGLDE